MTSDSEKDLRGPAIIIRGTPLTGWKFIGPFSSIDEAVSWWQRTIEYTLNEAVTIALLESPGGSRFEE